MSCEEGFELLTTEQQAAVEKAYEAGVKSLRSDGLVPDSGHRIRLLDALAYSVMGGIDGDRLGKQLTLRERDVLAQAAEVYGRRFGSSTIPDSGERISGAITEAFAYIAINLRPNGAAS